jgi:DNA-binding CsgD family transcriptional regulator/PAS domain-containing protein
LTGSDAGRAIATETVAVGLVDTQTATVTAGNRAYAELVGHAAESLAGLPVAAYLDLPRADAAHAVLAQMRDGWVDFVEGDIELRGPGGPIHAHSWSLALGGRPPRRKVIAGAVPTRRSPEHDHFSGPATDPSRTILATLDHDWRFRDLAPRSASLLGWPAGREGAARLHEIVHPADDEALATVLDATAIELGSTTAELRLRGRHEAWLDARVTVSRLYGLTSAPFVSVIGFAAATNQAEPEVDRVNRLEAYLARIGAEVRAAGVVTPRPATTFIELSELTDRQNEIVRRLVGGQRVAAIAQDLFVSQSTVRNHLSAIYKALGVKSQAELIGHVLTEGPPLRGRTSR